MQMGGGNAIAPESCRDDSLATFSIVLLKLVLVDLWLLPTIGKSGRLYNLGSYLIGSLLLVSEVENRLVR